MSTKTSNPLVEDPPLRCESRSSKWSVPMANGIEIKNRPPLTIHDAVETRTPELTATVVSMPCFWKKRTRAARTAGVPSASPLKVLDNSSMINGNSGTLIVIEPSVEKDELM